MLLAAIAAAVVALAAPARASTPALVLKPCVVQELAARCGYFLVPENRAKPAGRKIALRVVVLPALGKPVAPDAFTFLAGGPGGAATEEAAQVSRTYVAVREHHDVLLVDQRGTGVSNALDCPPPPQTQDIADVRSYIRKCLAIMPGDMRFYGTRAAMDDLDAVRAALGYRQLDVYGVSYGATAAQIYLKRHPSSVRTLTLDGATALDVPFFGRFARNAESALAKVAARCAADGDCARAFPHWRATLGTLVAAWNAHPVKTANGDALNGNALAGAVQNLLRTSSGAASIPKVVARAAAGDTTLLQQAIAAEAGPQTSLMYWTIWCNEPWVGLGAKGPWGTIFDSLTESSIATARQICSLLPAHGEPASGWTEPRSQVPVLLLAGGIDPQDPLANMPHLKQDFPSSRAIVVPFQGHGVGGLGCLGDVVAQLVQSGSVKGLDTRCVGAILPAPLPVS